MRIAIYPGSFDPITNGHFDIIKRAVKVFDKVVVAILINPEKKSLFQIDERVELVKRVIKGISNVEVISFGGLLVNLLKEYNTNIVLKGLRTSLDFDYERQMAVINKKLDSNIETICLMTSPENIHISSSVVKQIARFNGDIQEFVPKEILDDIINKIKI